MRLLDSIVVHHKDAERYIELYQGDLTDIPAEQSVDILVVSAFPNNYVATPGTLIAALDRKGISVQNLSRNKASDMRENFSCWLSTEISTSEKGIGFKRILCFEPRIRGRAGEVVRDIFACLTPIVVANPSITKVAMPLVATGMQGAAPQEVLEPLVDAAIHWLELGLPVTHLKIVEYSEGKALKLKEMFARLKAAYTAPVLEHTESDEAQLSEGTQFSSELPQEFKYDLFISYSHENSAEVLYLLEELQKLRPALRVFLDRQELNIGSAWQQEIYDALDQCRKVVAVYSPTYLASKVCKEEFNIAMFRHRDSDEGVLMPIYLTSTHLPTYMKLVQFIDCREADREKMRLACKEILAKLD